MILELAGSDILFHRTDVISAAYIVTQDAFSLKPSDANQSEGRFHKPSYYLSAARSMRSSYIGTSVPSTSVVFQLDGRKLNQRYKVVPIDYWTTLDPGALSKEEHLFRRSSQFEMEDRVLSQKPKIPATPFIQAVHAMNSTGNARREKALYDLYKWSLLRKVPFFVYDDVPSFLSRNKSKAVKIDFKPMLKQTAPTYLSDEYHRRKAKEQRRAGPLMGYWILWNHPVPPDATREQVWSIGKRLDSKNPSNRIKFLLELLSSSRDATRAFSEELHNAKSVAHGDVTGERETLDKLVALFRKHRMTPQMFIEELVKKWKR